MHLLSMTMKHFVSIEASEVKTIFFRGRNKNLKRADSEGLTDGCDSDCLGTLNDSFVTDG